MFTDMAKELEMPWRAVEAMHWELGAEGIAHRTGTPAFTSLSTSSDPAPAFVVSTEYQQQYAAYPQGSLPSLHVATGGQVPGQYPPQWTSPPYPNHAYPGQQSYWVAHPYNHGPPPIVQNNLSVPRERRSTSTTSSTRTRAASGSRRSTMEAEVQSSVPRSFARHSMQANTNEHSRYLPSPLPEHQVSVRHETAPPQLPSFNAVEAATRTYYPSPEYPSPPNVAKMAAPIIREPLQEVTSNPADRRPSISPQAVSSGDEASARSSRGPGSVAASMALNGTAEDRKQRLPNGHVLQPGDRPVPGPTNRDVDDDRRRVSM